MSDLNNEPRVAKALEELHQYLSDQLAPLMVVDTIEVLSECPPEIVGNAIFAWVGAQYRTGQAIPASDYFFHAIKKIHMMKEYKLLPPEKLMPFLQQLKYVVLEYCPTEDREILRKSLENIGEGSAAMAAPVEVIYRQAGGTSDTSHAKLASSSEVRGPKEMDEDRFNRLMRKLERGLGALAAAGEAVGTERHRDVVGDALAEAARSAQVVMELDRWLAQLRSQGIDAKTEDVFRALGKNLTVWSVPDKLGVQLPEDRNLRAMHRIVAEAPDPREGATRFHELVKAAVERFNEGALNQAASMIDLAMRIINAKEVDEKTVEILRRKGDENLDQEQMRKYAEDPEQQASLKKILNFFTSMSPQGLLDTLHKESKRDRRRLLLLLLECHGEPTRTAAITHLTLPLGQHQTEAEIYFRRNLIYLLGKIPPSPIESLKDLSEIIAQHADLIYPPLLIKEAVTYLGHLKSERSEEALTTLIANVEDLLMNPAESPYEIEELHLIIDRIVGSLARLATPGSWKTVLDHAFKKKPKLGDTMSRLTELSKQDLSKDVEIVERLLASLRANMPVKLLGLVIQQKDQDLQYIIEALSSTPLPRVRRALEEVKQKYPDRAAGAAATKALANIEQAAALKRPEGVKPSLMGDLDLFGLPSLLQSLSELAATGCLVLKNSSGDVIGTLFLEKGKLHSCHAGALTGDAAFYQLFEWPQPGTFQFSRTGERMEESVELRDLLPLTLEGIRRYDELQQCRSVVPDKAKLVLKSDRPVALPDEKDGLFFRDLWTTVRSGATPLECDAAVTADSYRVRRLLVHWVEQGAIEAAQ
ncbi:MAG TPA: DUF4388 domain-containing protein [Acidobacteriota bacterium]|nr:DUF4388 domain-containing protein [Acidobacteriota bacterium]